MPQSPVSIQGYPLVDADTIDQGTGYKSRDYDAYPIGGLKCAKRYDTAGNVDPARYQALIEQKNAEKSWITDLIDAKDVGVTNQGNSSYCWIHAPVMCMQIVYAQQGGPTLKLSPFYAGAHIKNGRNQGGSGITGVSWLQDNGTCLLSMHAAGNFKVNNDPATVANAQLHKITEYDEFDPGDHASIISAVLNNIPVTVGVPAWSHEVTIVKLLWDTSATWNKNIIYVIANSWGDSWGTRGFGALSRAYSRFDEAGAVRACSPATT